MCRYLLKAHCWPTALLFYHLERPHAIRLPLARAPPLYQQRDLTRVLYTTRAFLYSPGE